MDITAKLLTVKGDSKALDELNVITQVYKEEKVPRYDRYGNFQGFATHYGYDAWKNFGAVLGKWDRTLNGDTWKIVFTEIDPAGQTITIKKSFSSTFEFGIKTTDASKSVIGFNAGYKGAETGEVTYTMKDVDDALGEQFIYYCDKIGAYQFYSTGSVYFTIALIE